MNHADAKYSRRDILKLATCSSVITTLSGVSAGCGLFEPDLETAAQRMIDTLNHVDRAREIGEAYMAQSPDVRDQSPELLARNLLTILNLDSEEISRATINALEGRLSERVRRDFVEENVVILGRWMLSRTEVLLCALAAMKA